MEVDQDNSGGSGPGNSTVNSTSDGGNDYIQQFKILAKTTSGKATSAICEKVMKHKHIFVFSEILELDCVQKLKGTEEDGVFRALEIFAYGTIQDYLREQGSLPPLSDVQAKKLRQLSLVTLASKGSKTSLTYEDMFKALDVETKRDLENLIIESIYAGLIRGKLYQREEEFHVYWVMGRDVRVTDIDEISKKFDTWCSRSEQLLKSLETIMKGIDVEKENGERAVERAAADIKKLLISAGNQNSKKIEMKFRESFARSSAGGTSSSSSSSSSMMMDTS